VIVTAGALALTFAANAQKDQKPPQAAPESSQDSAAAPGPTTAPVPIPVTNTTAIRANNIGMALMDRQQFGEALGRFQTACVMDVTSDVGCVNMGIALLNMKQYDDARKILEKSADRDAQNPRAWFNLALLERVSGQSDDVPPDAAQPDAATSDAAPARADASDAAMSDFQKVAAIDPNDADTQYWIGLLYLEKQQYAPAIAALKKAVKLNPFHASAESSLEQALRQTGDVDGAIDHLNRYQHITEQNLGKPIGTAYGDQGKYSLAAELLPDAQPAPPAPSGSPVHFVNVTSLSGLPAQFELSGARDRTPKAAKASTAPDLAGTSSATSPPVQSLASFLGSGACIIDYDNQRSETRISRRGHGLRRRRL
jgi:tetratricopeptide (TPR) repeat protein